MFLSGDELEQITRRADELEKGLYTYRDRGRLLDHIAVQDRVIERLSSLVKNLSVGQLKDVEPEEIARRFRTSAVAELETKRKTRGVV